MVKARPLAIEIEENPSPTAAFQTIGGLSASHSERQPFSREMPFRSGPRQQGQSFAAAANGTSSKNEKSITARSRKGGNANGRLNILGIASLWLVGSASYRLI
jgi:hypothetical protein